MAYSNRAEDHVWLAAGSSAGLEQGRAHCLLSPTPMCAPLTDTPFASGIGPHSEPTSRGAAIAGAKLGFTFRAIALAPLDFTAV